MRRLMLLVVVLATVPGAAADAASGGDPSCGSSLPKRALACAELTGVASQAPVRPPRTRATAGDATGCALAGVDDRCERWVSHFNYPNGSDAAAWWDEPRGSDVAPDGSRVFVVGNSYDKDVDGMVYTTLSFDAGTGARIWSRHYDGPSARGNNYSHDLEVSPDGARVYVTGGEGTIALQQGNFGTVAYDAATGATLWEAVYDNRADGIDLAYDLAVSPDGETLYVVGQSRGSGSSINYDYATVAYEADTGRQLWAARFDGPASGSYDSADQVVVSEDGALVYVSGFGNSTDFITFAYRSADGAVAWQTQEDFGGSDNPADMALSPGGDTLLITGSGGTTRIAPTVVDTDVATVAYHAATGTRRWAGRWSRALPQNEWGAAIAVSPDGARAFIAAQVGGDAPKDLDFGVIAYGVADGAELWSMTYSGPTWYDESARDIAISPDGSRLYVTGEQSDGFTQWWSVTLALETGDAAVAWRARYSINEAGFAQVQPQTLSAGGGRVFTTALFSGIQPQDGDDLPLSGDRVAMGVIAYDG